MLIDHVFSLDMLEPGTPTRIQVKQGDTQTHGLKITLLAGGEPWIIPSEATPVVRWFACDPDSGESARGIFDTLPNGVHAWTFAENQLDLVLVPQMFSLPGIVRADVAFVAEEKVLATFDFEFYVNRAPADGTEPQAQDYYKVATLEQLNATLDALQVWQANVEQMLSDLTQDVADLQKAVSKL